MPAFTAFCCTHTSLFTLKVFQHKNGPWLLHLECSWSFYLLKLISKNIVFKFKIHYKQTSANVCLGIRLSCVNSTVIVFFKSLDGLLFFFFFIADVDPFLGLMGAVYQRSQHLKPTWNLIMTWKTWYDFCPIKIQNTQWKSCSTGGLYSFSSILFVSLSIWCEMIYLTIPHAWEFLLSCLCWRFLPSSEHFYANKLHA